jgi:hypothetical protein
MQEEETVKVLRQLRRQVARLNKAVFSEPNSAGGARPHQAGERKAAKAGEPDPRIGSFLDEMMDDSEAVKGYRGTVLVATRIASHPSGNSVSTAVNATTLDSLFQRDLGRIAHDLSVVSTEQSLNILRELFGEARTIKDIEASTELTGSQIYHYISKMSLVGIVVSRGGGRYALTGDGQVLLAVLLAIGNRVPPQAESAQGAGSGSPKASANADAEGEN